MEKTVHRYIFNLPFSVYTKLREVAFKRNISMSKYVLDALVWRLEQEKIDDETK